jgi:hypothetical protein
MPTIPTRADAPREWTMQRVANLLVIVRRCLAPAPPCSRW